MISWISGGRSAGRSRTLRKWLVATTLFALVGSAGAGRAPVAEAAHDGHFSIDVGGTVTVEFINAKAVHPDLQN